MTVTKTLCHTVSVILVEDDGTVVTVALYSGQTDSHAEKAYMNLVEVCKLDCESGIYEYNGLVETVDTEAGERRSEMTNADGFKTIVSWKWEPYN